MKESCVLKEAVCVECGTIICATSLADWVYANHSKNKRRYFCSYKCKKAYDERVQKEHEEQKRATRKDSTIAKVFYCLVDSDGYIDYGKIKEQAGVEEAKARRCIQQLKALAYIDYPNGKIPEAVEIWVKEFYQ